MRAKTFAAVVAATLLVSPLAVAEKGGKDKASKLKPNEVAKLQCNDFKKADRAAFKGLYGEKRGMRACKRANRTTAADLINNAGEQCKAEAAADPAAFALAHGNGKNAHGKCVSAKVREDVAATTTEFKNAANACKAERAADPTAFKAKYGTAQSKGRNALGKCVSATVRAPEPEPDPYAPTP